MPSGRDKLVPSSANDEPNEWDLRIERGGCAQEHFKLQDRYMESKRLEEMQGPGWTINDGADLKMGAFKACWSQKTTFEANRQRRT